MQDERKNSEKDSFDNKEIYKLIKKVDTQVIAIHSHLVGDLDSTGLNEDVRVLKSDVKDLQATNNRLKVGFWTLLLGGIGSLLNGFLNGR